MRKREPADVPGGRCLYGRQPPPEGDADGADSSENDVKEPNEDAANESGGWEDVIGSSDLQRKILSEGDGLRSPCHGDRAIVNVVARLESSDEVVEQYSNLSVVLGFYDVTQALDMCIGLMTVGEIDLIRTSPRFAYGQSGKPPNIPPDASLVYKVELLNVEDGPDLQQMTGEELLTFATEKKQRANYFYTALKNYMAATDIYEKALEALSYYATDDPKCRTLKAQIFNDLAATHLKLQSWLKAVDSADSCLEIEPKNVKALFRRSVACASLFKDEEALRDLRMAAELAPENKLIAGELTKLTANVQRHNAVQKRMFKAMIRPRPVRRRSQQRKNWRSYAYVAAAVVCLVCAIFVYRFYAP